MSCAIFHDHNRLDSAAVHHILKVFDCGSTLLLLTKDSSLLISDKSDFVRLRDCVIDASYIYPLFYIVDTEGKVLKTNIEQIHDSDQWHQIEIEKKIRKVNSNSDGVLFTTDERELMGMGNFGNVLISDEPKMIECFNNFTVLQVATGDNFAIVLVQQKSVSDSWDGQINDENFMDKTRDEARKILKTQVWSFGSINNGLLGTGDHPKRASTSIIIKLADIGVCHVYCGSHHAAALTLDGRIFLWGFNNHQQISLEIISDLSAPTELKTADKHVLAAACGSISTVILFNDLSFKVLGKLGPKEHEEFASELRYEQNASNENLGIVPYIVSHGKILLVNHKNLPIFLTEHLPKEQKLLRNYINIHQRCIKIPRTHELRKLLEVFETIFSICIVNVCTCHKYLLNNCEHKLEEIIINTNFTEFMKEMHRFLRVLCDVKSFYSTEQYTKNIGRETVELLMVQPFECLEVYKQLLDVIFDIKRCDDPPVDDAKMEELRLQTLERKQAIENFQKVTMKQRLQEAEATYLFWHNLRDTVVEHELHAKERRFILDSQQMPLKLLDRNTIFGSNRFILFNDYLVCLLNRPEFIPIHLVWLHQFSSSGKFTFRIVTPENQLKVFTLTANDRSEWQMRIRECTWKALRITPATNQALPIIRNGSYKFSERNQKYANYEVDGRWCDGKFYDLCHIKIPSINRQFKCRIDKGGELIGHGIVEDDTFIFQGDFLHGKLHGHGSMKSKGKSIHYQGYFKHDKHQGFGTMLDANGIYHGEFANGVMCGYGVEDDARNGNKYIGMWQDGKRHGAGILITIDGSYFEGIFANNNLSGDGLAIFPDGSYFIGEVTVDGPGSGSLYLPDSEIIEEIAELDSNLKMKGKILKGTLSGTWEKVGISNGNMMMNEVFPKTPNSSNNLKIRPNRKWASLFENWKESVFGSPTPEHLNKDERWNRVAIYMNRRRHFQKDLEKNFMLISKASSIESLDFDEKPLPTAALPGIGRSNSEIFLRDISKNFDTNSLRSISDYAIGENGPLIDNKKYSRSAELDFVPSLVKSNFTTTESIVELKEYLIASFSNENHPLCLLISDIRCSFAASYGNWKCKPASIMSNIAMNEWISICRRIYGILRLLFPNLPAYDADGKLQENDDCKMKSPLNFMHQILLNDEIYSCFFLLYASKLSKLDELYSQRMLTCERKTNEELRQLLGIDANLVPLVEDSDFYEAIKTFQRISQMFCPLEMMEIIGDTYKLIDNCAIKTQKQDSLSADVLLPITVYLIIKANVNHLGAELSLLTDLMSNEMMDQYLYTTVVASYMFCISSRFFHN